MQTINNKKDLHDIYTDIIMEDPGHFLDEGTEALHVISPEGIIVWANKKELQILGYSKEEYIGHHISEFYCDRDTINDILCILVNNKEVINYSAEIKCKDGTIIQALLSSNVYQKDGDFIYARSSMRDISEIKSFQTRLENSNARIINQLLNSNTLINLITSSNWKTDHQGHITTLQPSWHLYTGQECDEQLNYGWLNAIHPDDKTSVTNNLNKSLKENRDFHSIGRVYCKKNNDFIYCGIYATPYIDMHNHCFEWNFILIDQTKVMKTDSF